MESLRGQLLIAGGSMYDPNFRHTVVLVGDHGAEGALGVILNRALNVTVRKVFPPLAALVPPDEPLYQGGPVQVEGAVLLAELTNPELADILVLDSVGFLVGEVSEAVRPHIRRAKIFAGYAGWAPGQLESELAQDAWILEPARVEDIFTDAPDLLWSRVLRRKGPEYHQLSKLPYDPRMN